ncbi:MAG: DNA-protecting protein DprA [Burkholderiales bacterium]|nr:DNA-protecting protein DprA [Burkholderiales bacterium]
MAHDIETIAPSSTQSWLRLTLVQAVPPHKQRALLQRFGGADAVFAASRDALSEVIGETGAQALARGPEPRLLEATHAWLQRPGCRLVGLGDPAYPALWKQIAIPPCAFYVQGRVELLNKPALAIVGSRNATPRGVSDAHEFARSLADEGVVIASGLARGIDAAAHRGGLAGAASTIAVMGTGPDVVYPHANESLAREIAGRGCIVSEFPVGTPPLERNFPRRNRLISGLARGVLVVEAAPRSGSLGTARAALEQNRDVFAIPGSIHSPLSKGCHWLIKEGAKLVDCVDDIAHEIGIRAPCEQEPPSAADPVLEAMGFAPVTPEHIIERTGLDAATLAARLSWLEIEGRVQALAGGWFQRAEKRVIE